ISAIYFLSLITSLVVMERCARPSGRKPELTTEEKGWLQSVCARMCVCVCVCVWGCVCAFRILTLHVAFACVLLHCHFLSCLFSCQKARAGSVLLYSVTIRL